MVYTFDEKGTYFLIKRKQLLRDTKIQLANLLQFWKSEYVQPIMRSFLFFIMLVHLQTEMERKSILGLVQKYVSYELSERNNTTQHRKR